MSTAVPHRGNPTRKERLASDVWASINALLERCRDAFLDLGAQLALTPGEMKALQTLDPEAPKAMRDLAEAWRCDASNVTWIVDRLEARGLVERALSDQDRRIRTVALTADGETARAEILSVMTSPPPALLALTTTQLETLHEALGRLPIDVPDHGCHRGWCSPR